MRTAPYFTALGLLTILHAWNVIKLRTKHRIALGDGGNPVLLRAIRTHGNHIEYVPLGLLLIAGLEFVQAPGWYLHLAGATLLIGRLLHAYGLNESVLKFRVAGMMLTLVSLAVSSVGVSLFSFLPHGLD